MADVTREKGGPRAAVFVFYTAHPYHVLLRRLSPTWAFPEWNLAADEGISQVLNRVLGTVFGGRTVDVVEHNSFIYTHLEMGEQFHAVAVRLRSVTQPAEDYEWNDAVWKAWLAPRSKLIVEHPEFEPYLPYVECGWVGKQFS